MQSKFPEKNGESKSGGSANAASHSESEGEGVFAAFPNSPGDSEDEERLPELFTVSDSDEWFSNHGDDDASAEDWFSEIGEDNSSLVACGTRMALPKPEEMGSDLSLQLKTLKSLKTLGVASVINKGAEITLCTKLYLTQDAPHI